MTGWPTVNRWTDRPTNWWTDRPTDQPMDRPTDWWTDRPTDGPTDQPTTDGPTDNWWTDRQLMDRPTNWWTDRPADNWWTDRPTDGLTDPVTTQWWTSQRPIYRADWLWETFSVQQFQKEGLRHFLVSDSLSVFRSIIHHYIDEPNAERCNRRTPPPTWQR